MNDANNNNEKTSIQFSLKDSPGMLLKALSIFTQNNLNLTRIHSKPARYIKESRIYEFSADFVGEQTDPKVAKAIEDLNKIADKVEFTGIPEVPWFPMCLADLDDLGKNVLTQGNGFETIDHPSFTDKAYY
jgi:prephenate dehydratase